MYYVDSHEIYDLAVISKPCLRETLYRLPKCTLTVRYEHVNILNNNFLTMRSFVKNPLLWQVCHMLLLKKCNFVQWIPMGKTYVTITC